MCPSSSSAAAKAHGIERERERERKPPFSSLGTTVEGEKLRRRRGRPQSFSSPTPVRTRASFTHPHHPCIIIIVRPNLLLFLPAPAEVISPEHTFRTSKGSPRCHVRCVKEESRAGLYLRDGDKLLRRKCCYLIQSPLYFLILL